MWSNRDSCWYWIWEDGRCHDAREMGTAQFWSMFQGGLPAGLKEMGTEKVRQGLLTAIGISLYFQKDEKVHYMFPYVFVDNTLSVGHLKGASFVQQLLAWQARNKSSLAQPMSWPTSCDLSFTSMHSVFGVLVAKEALVYNVRLQFMYACGIHCLVGMMVINACTRPAGLQCIQSTLQAYVIYNSWTIIFEVIVSY